MNGPLCYAQAVELIAAWYMVDNYSEDAKEKAKEIVVAARDKGKAKAYLPSEDEVYVYRMAGCSTEGLSISQYDETRYHVERIHMPRYTLKENNGNKRMKPNKLLLLNT